MVWEAKAVALQVAAILHDCGKFVSLANGPDCAYDIIMASEIIGLSHLEREIVASTVRYNTRPLDAYERVADKMDITSYMTAAKLFAILQVSNALTMTINRNWFDQKSY